MNAQSKSVLTMGELLWDMLPDGKKPGGAPANFVYHAAQNGVKATAVTAVGDDELGRELVQLLTERGVNVAAQTNEYATGITAVSLDENGVPSYDVVRDRARDHIAFTDQVRTLVENADAICYGSIAAREPHGTRDAIYAMIDAAGPDTVRFFDINIRSGFADHDVLERMLNGATILKINDEELPIVARLFGIDEPEFKVPSQTECVKAIKEMFDLDVVILTAGDSYSLVMDDETISMLPTPKVEVADTVGAGDSFSGAFLAYWLRGFSLRAAHERAIEVSAFVCTQQGAWPEYPAQLQED